MKKHIFLFAFFIFISCMLVAQSSMRRIEAKKKTQDDFDNSFSMMTPELVFNVGHAGRLNHECYSPDGKYIASCSNDKTIKIWEVETGRCVRTLLGHTASVTSVSYSSDSKYLASSSEDGTIKIWEIEASKCINTIITMYASRFSIITYSPDDQYIASCSYGNCSKEKDFHIFIWDIETGRPIREFEGHTWEVYYLKYSSDGRYLASGSWDQTIKIWDVVSDRCIKTFDCTGNIYSLVYSSDNKYLTVKFSHEYEEGKTEYIVQVWDVENNLCTKILKEEENQIPDFINTIKTNVSSINSIFYSPNGDHIVLGDMDRKVKIFDVRTGKMIKNLTGHRSGVYSVTYSSDGKYIASGSGWLMEENTYDSTIKIWDVDNEKCIKTFECGTNGVGSIAYRHDGKYIASAPYSLQIWEVKNEKCIGVLREYLKDDYDYEKYVLYSHNDKYLAVGLDKGLVSIWDGNTNNFIKTLTTGSERSQILSSLAFSPDDKYLAIACDVYKDDSYISNIFICDVETGVFVNTFESDSPIKSIIYSPDGDNIIGGYEDNTVRIWNVKTGRCLYILSEHASSVNSVTCSPDGKHIASASSDGTIKFWNITTGEFLATTLNLKDGEWLTYTPEGFFAGSEWATKNLVHVVNGMKTVGIDQMYDSLYRPDLVSAKLRGDDISEYAKKANFKILIRSGSAPITTFLNIDEKLLNRDVTIEYSIKDTGGGIGEVNLLLNGKNIRLAESVPSKSGEILYFSHTITLQQGDNTVELYAKNKAGKIESLRARKILKWNGNIKKPNLYVLTIAINKYRDRELQLKYAVTDAEAIIKGFESQKMSLYGNIFTFNLFDDNVTKEGLKASFQEFSKKVEADDVFVFYIAGHGITYEDGDYYYLPSDFRYTSYESIQKRGISKNDLTRLLSLIKAEKTLVLLDTCNSGSFLDSASRGLTEKTAIDRLTRSTGHAIIVASTDTQSAMEGYEGHGIFTYILVEGLTGKADRDVDGFITLQELSSYVEEEVPRRSYEKWGYEQIPQRDLRHQDFPIYMK